VPNVNLSAFQKGTMFTAIELFNRLPKTIQSFKEDRISFKMNLFLYLMNNYFIILLTVCVCFVFSVTTFMSICLDL
jgi:hypothetical protein